MVRSNPGLLTLPPLNAQIGVIVDDSRFTRFPIAEAEISCEVTLAAELSARFVGISSQRKILKKNCEAGRWNPADETFFRHMITDYS